MNEKNELQSKKFEQYKKKLMIDEENGNSSLEIEAIITDDEKTKLDELSKEENECIKITRNSLNQSSQIINKLIHLDFELSNTDENTSVQFIGSFLGGSFSDTVRIKSEVRELEDDLRNLELEIQESSRKIDEIIAQKQSILNNIKKRSKNDACINSSQNITINKKALGAELIEALKTNDIIKINEAIDKGADVNFKSYEGDTPLTLACREEIYNEIIKKIISKNVNVNEKNSDGRTALMIASANNNINIVKLLIEAGADQDTQSTIRNSTALIYASSNGHYEVCEFLIKNKANVNLYDCNNNSALIHVSTKGYTEITKLLLKNGADVNLYGKRNMTALIHAAGEGHIEIVKLLLNSGADVNARNQNNMTALRKASSNNHTEIVEILKAHGGIR